MCRETTVKDYAIYVYGILELETDGFDSVYEDYIVQLVGLHGLIALKQYRLIESCGVINDRQLYALSDISRINQSLL